MSSSNEDFDEQHLLDEIKNILIVDKLNVAPIDGLLRVLFLLHLEHML